MATVLRASSRDWEQLFRTWAQAPSQTEIEKCERAERAIRAAIADETTLALYGLQTFAQGSYANRTNVRQDSDVDICVLNKNVCLTHYPPGVTQQQAGLVDSPYSYRQYKDEVGHALVNHFGSAHVTRGNKAFDVLENTYRFDSDVVTCFEFRLYYLDRSDTLCYHSGTALVTDREGKRITNFPQQQYDNGVAKNDVTGRRFKGIVRVLKKLRYEMEGAGYASAKLIASFLLESLAFNVQNSCFTQKSYVDSFREVVSGIYNSVNDPASAARLVETNGIQRIFRVGQDWTADQAKSFLVDAWNYVLTT